MLKRGRVAFFVTGNVHKFHEARCVLSKFGISVAMLNKKPAELQHDDLGEIARASVLEAAHECGLPVFVEDAGLFVAALRGFPGPYSSYVFRTLGTGGVLRLMEGVEERGACFRSVVAFLDPDGKGGALSFEGRVDGVIAREQKGEHGFGFDPIFVPKAEPGKTFAQMTLQEKSRYSHRSLALQEFADWYVHHFHDART